MADPIPNPTPPPSPPAPKPAPPARARSLLDKQELAELQKASEIAAVALKAAYAPRLARREIKAEDLAALQTDIQAARDQGGSTVQKITAKEGITGSEIQLKGVLVGLLQGVQKAAKQKATRSGSNALLKKYAVGDKFYSSRTLLEQTAANFLSNAPADQLPGIDAAALDAIRQALTTYQQVQSEQSGAQSDPTTERQNLASAVVSIARRRREIRLAADAEWPHTDPANAGIRAEFKLPPRKTLK